MSPAYLKPDDAARYMSVSRTTLYRYIGERTLPSSKIGGRTIIAIKDIDALIKATRREAIPARGRE